MGKKWKPTGNPMGAPVIKMINVPEDGKIPEKVIDFNQVMYWAELQSTQEEVAGSFRVSVETLNSRLMEHIGMTYSELRKRVDGNAKMSLRRFQFKQSERNATMAIWLGKNWLGQRDSQEIDKSPQDSNLNFADAYIRSEGEKAALNKKIQDLENKINQLTHNPCSTPSMPFLPPCEPIYVTTCASGAETVITEKIKEIDDHTQSKTDSVLQRSDKEIQYMGGCCSLGQNVFKHS